MESADLKKLECSVCWKICTDPLTLKCGHNFCQDCIGRVLDTQERSGRYSCPECYEEFQEWPALRRNITLQSLVENFLSAQPDQEEFGVFCAFCIDTPVPAVKSCLHCEASLCNNHLRVHSKSSEHVLRDPTTSLENRKCSIHKKILEYYCTEDSTCICVSCRLDGGHQVETLDEASEMKKKLRNVLEKLMTKREETEKRVQSLQEHRRKVQGKTDDETKRVTALFRDLRRRLEDLEKRVLSEISRQTERVSLSLSDLIQQLEIKKEELSRKMGDIEELCNMTDPLTVLQESDTGNFCDTEDRDEDRARHDKLLHDGGDLDVVGISHTLHIGLSDIMSGVNVQKCKGTHVYPHCTTKGKGHINAELSRRRPQSTPTIQRSHSQAAGPIEAEKQRLVRLRFTDILLDVRTASNFLHISDDRKTASWSLSSFAPIILFPPPTTLTFQYPQVISCQGFSSGRHSLEVDVRRSEYWIVGMCYPSIDRNGSQSAIGCNKKSWGLIKSGHNQYSVIHDNGQIPIPSKVRINRLRIDLAYEAGLISFYDLREPTQHLYTFASTFTEPLHAGIYLWRGSIKLCVSYQKPEIRPETGDITRCRIGEILSQ